MLDPIPSVRSNIDRQIKKQILINKWIFSRKEGEVLIKNLLNMIESLLLWELEPETEPEKKPGAGQKRTGSATLFMISW